MDGGGARWDSPTAAAEVAKTAEMATTAEIETTAATVAYM
jgi:hypothetical protein